MDNPSTIARKLDMLAELLSKKNLVIDTNPLAKAASMCRDKSTSDEWEYRIDRLLFQPRSTHLKSKDSINHSSIKVELSITIKGVLDPEEGQDPLTHLAMDIVIFSDTRDGRKVTGAWHLDRHIENPDDGMPYFMHPQYHFQFGGHQLEKAVNGNFGSVLVLDSPRLAYPPMDVFLSIDFVLTNFFEKSELAIRKDGTYRNLIEEMQKELWGTYFASLHGHWQANADDLPWKSSAIWPQMLKKT
jgi:hypothetical protein